MNFSNTGRTLLSHFSDKPRQVDARLEHLQGLVGGLVEILHEDRPDAEI